MFMITIVDYGVGNITSVQKAFESLGVSTLVTSDPEKIALSKSLVVPGQGACEQAMTQLRKKSLILPIKAHIQEGKPFLGICLGFQILFEHSEEDGGVDCLGILKGNVKKFQLPQLKVPHMGWNSIKISEAQKEVVTPVKSGDYVYFVHSYYVDTSDKEAILAITEYGHPFVSAIRKNNLWGTQFHPEKSGDVGLSLLTAFLGGILPRP